MLNFDYNRYSYSSRRNVVFARKGMACSCVPLASQVGIDTMKRGGNAMDAAIAMAVTLPLVEPTCNGLGSDCFALMWSAKDGKLYGLNGSGLAPKALSAQKVLNMGYTQMPVNGWLPTMVPGAPAAWAELRRRFGSMSMAELRAWIAALSDGESQPESTPSTQTGQGWEEEAEHETGHGSGHGNGHGYGYGGPPW